MKTQLKYGIALLFSAVLFFQFGCNPQGKGFALPEGNIDSGKRSFVELNCNQCHSINDIQWAGVEDQGDVHIKLGGEVTNIKTYGELLTSVINPSHKIARKYKEEATDGTGQSKMRVYNEYMTVQDLVDIVTFLQNEYEIMPPPNPYYY